MLVFVVAYGYKALVCINRLDTQHLNAGGLAPLKIRKTRRTNVPESWRTANNQPLTGSIAVLRDCCFPLEFQWERLYASNEKRSIVKNENAYYYPNTVLKEDLRNLTKSPQQRVVATFFKNQKDRMYTKLSYMAKGFHIEDIRSVVENKVDLQ